MNDKARLRAQRLALILGGMAVLFGIGALLVDAFQGDDFKASLLVPLMVGLVVIAFVQRWRGPA